MRWGQHPPDTSSVSLCELLRNLFGGPCWCRQDLAGATSVLLSPLPSRSQELGTRLWPGCLCELEVRVRWDVSGSGPRVSQQKGDSISLLQ